MTSPAEVAVAIPKTHSRPALLTLQGLYSGTKMVYSTYCPAKASELLEAAMAKVLASGVPAVEPYVAKVLPENKEPLAMPTDLAAVDALLAAAFSTGDAKIDEYVAAAHGQVDGAKAAVSAKVGAVKATASASKAWTVGKYHDATLANAKLLVQRKMGEEPFSSAASAAAPYVERAQPYYDAVAANVAPAKAVLGDLVFGARQDLANKGVVQVAKDSAEALKLQGLSALEVCKAKGAVAGVRELSASALAAAVAKLDEAKAVDAPPVSAPAPTPAPASSPPTPQKEVFEDAAADAAE